MMGMRLNEATTEGGSESHRDGSLRMLGQGSESNKNVGMDLRVCLGGDPAGAAAVQNTGVALRRDTLGRDWEWQLYRTLK